MNIAFARRLSILASFVLVSIILNIKSPELLPDLHKTDEFLDQPVDVESSFSPKSSPETSPESSPESSPNPTSSPLLPSVNALPLSYNPSQLLTPLTRDCEMNNLATYLNQQQGFWQKQLQKGDTFTQEGYNEFRDLLTPFVIGDLEHPLESPERDVPLASQLICNR